MLNKTRNSASAEVSGGEGSGTPLWYSCLENPMDGGAWWATAERLHFHFSLSCIEEGNDDPLQCSCLENPRDGGAPWASIYGVAQSQTRLKGCSSNSRALFWIRWGFLSGSDGKESACNARDLVQSLGWEDPLEEGMATHSGILAWRIPWTEEPGGLQSMQSQKVRHN